MVSSNSLCVFRIIKLVELNIGDWETVSTRGFNISEFNTERYRHASSFILHSFTSDVSRKACCIFRNDAHNRTSKLGSLKHV